MGERIDDPGVIAEAAKLGNLREVKRLLRAGAAVDEWAVFWATYNGYLSIVKLLVKNGATVYADAVDEAEAHGRSEIGRFLRDYLEKKKENEQNGNEQIRSEI